MQWREYIFANGEMANVRYPKIGARVISTRTGTDQYGKRGVIAGFEHDLVKGENPDDPDDATILIVNWNDGLSSRHMLDHENRISEYPFLEIEK